MRIRLQSSTGSPQWNDGGERRLIISYVVATLLVAAILSVLRMPTSSDFAPIVDFVVRIIESEPLEPEAVAEKVPAEVPDEVQPPVQATEEIIEPTDASQADPFVDAAAPAADSAIPVQTDSSVDSHPPVDWETTQTEAASAYLDERDNPPSPNPVLAEKRRRLAGQYKPRTIPLPKKIWENVEKDQLGRTVLRSGNCFKVLDDPNVGSRQEFEDFGQYMAKCTYQKRNPKELPWVDEIRQRYPYLRDPDGYLEGVDGPNDITPSTSDH